jgi:hypothetical protein
MKAIYQKFRRFVHSLAFAIATILIFTVLLPVSPRAQSSKQIHGLVEEPRLGDFSKVRFLPRSHDIVCSGWVNFSGANGLIEIDVLNFGNGASDSKELWEKVAGPIRPALEARVVNGESQYAWSGSIPEGVFPLAASFRLPPIGTARLPIGGTARIRFRAIVDPNSGFNETEAQLPVQDEENVIGKIPELILTNTEDTCVREDPEKEEQTCHPSTPAHLDQPPQFEQPPHFLGRKLLEEEVKEKPVPIFETTVEEATAAYYRGVGTGQKGGGPSIAEGLPTEQKFIDRYFKSIEPGYPFSEPDVQATYFNRGDLGLGREMHCSYNGRTKETACYVKNFGKLIPPFDLPAPGFGDIRETARAILSHKPFATVGMVERGQMNIQEPNKIFFVVYENGKTTELGGCRAPGELACEAKLDNQAFNTSIPTNCLVCHGSAGQYVQNPPQVTNASFLPFDLSSFYYYDYDADLGMQYSRPMQEDAFRRLNRIVYFTDLYFNPDANELLNGWYGPFFSRKTFQDEFVPKGWALDSNARQLYRKVVAPYCRSCHISHSTSNNSFTNISETDHLRFATFDDFAINKSRVVSQTCQSTQPRGDFYLHEFIMPNAEQTSNYFWLSDARSHLLNRLGITSSGCGLPRPAAQSGSLSPTTLASTGRDRSALEVLEDYKTETCACTTKDCLMAVENKFVREAGIMGFDNPHSQEAIEALRSEASGCRQEILTKISPPPAKSLEERALDRDLEREKAFRH